MQVQHHRPALTGILAFYGIVGALAVWAYRYEINPDGVSYILVAEQYLAGNWANAVNGYWGPLLSWLLVPFMAVGFDGQIAFRIVQFLIGGVTIIGIWRVSRHVTASIGLRLVVLGVSTLLVLSWSVQFISPDLLGLCVLIYLCDLLLDRQLLGRPRLALLCGGIAALFYFAKPFGFIFFLGAFPVTVIASSLIYHRRLLVDQIVRTSIAGILVFLALVAPWVVTISAEYGGFTISPSGKRNLAFVGPVSDQVQLHDKGGFFLPPFDGAVNGWYDPSVEALPAWSPVGSFHEAKHEIRNTVAGFRGTASMIGAGSVLSLAWLLVSHRGFGLRIVTRSSLGLAAVIALLHATLYCIVRSNEERYHWPVIILLLFCAIGILGYKRQAGLLSNHVTGAWIVVLAVAWLLNPIFIYNGLFDSHFDFRGVETGISQHKQQGFYRSMAEFDLLPESPGRTASNDRWGYSLYLSHYRDASYYGVTTPGDSQETQRELNDAGIEWFLLWGPDNPVPPYLGDFTIIGTALDGELRVFRRG